MAIKSKRKSGSMVMEITGIDELVAELAHLGDDLRPQLLKALEESMKPVGEQMQAEMAKHTKPNGKGWSTGATYEAFVSEEIKNKNPNVIGWRVGYSVRKGGLAAIFWELGGAHIAPTWFMDKAAYDNLDAIVQKQREVLTARIEELKNNV